MKSQRQNVNSRVPEVTQGVCSLGLDIGYGVVKVVTDTTTIAFPSVMGSCKPRFLDAIETKKSWCSRNID